MRSVDCRSDQPFKELKYDGPTKGALSAVAKLWLILLGTVLVLAGLFLAIGGYRLITLGGSWYFIITGIAVVLSGLLVLMRRPLGAVLFVIVTLLTVVWAIWDAGLDFWPLISRLLAFGIGSTVVLLSLPLLRKARGLAPGYAGSFTLAAVLALASAGGVAGMFMPHPSVPFTGTPIARVPVDPASEQKNWEHYGNTSGGSRFAALDQINVDNVKALTVAWTYHTGDTPISPGNNGAEDQETPLQVGEKLFLCTPITTSSPSISIAASSCGRPRSTPSRRCGCGAAVLPISTRPVRWISQRFQAPHLSLR